MIFFLRFSSKYVIFSVQFLLSQCHRNEDDTDAQNMFHWSNTDSTHCSSVLEYWWTIRNNLNASRNIPVVSRYPHVFSGWASFNYPVALVPHLLDGMHEVSIFVPASPWKRNHAGPRVLSQRRGVSSFVTFLSVLLNTWYLWHSGKQK